MRGAYTIGAPSIFVNRNGLGRYPEFRDQGVGGSNPLSPTNSFQSLRILAYLESEPLVRVLWVPHCNCQVQRLLGVLVDRGLGHPIGAPIRICFAQILRGSRFEPAKLRCSRWSVVSQTLLINDPLAWHQGIGFHEISLTS